MLTNPNTLGLFDANIEEIARIVHGVGATLYYDGANLNAVMGISRPGDMGFDIVHFNLHKTFTQPHGGGGPGAGPIAVSGPHRALPAAPAGRAPRRATTAAAVLRPRLRPARSRSAGCAASRATTACFVRSYAYIRSLGAEGLRETSETAVLNANYLLARLRGAGRRRVPAGRLRPPVHARVRALRRADEARAADQDARPRQAPARPRRPPADRLLPAARRRGAADRAHRDRDQGDARRRSPTSIAEILREAREDPEIARNAPYTTPVRRLDEAAARPSAGHSPAALAPAGSLRRRAHLLRHPAHRAQAPRQLHRRDHPVRRGPGPRRGDLLHRRPARDHRPLRARRAARAPLRHDRDPARRRARPRALHPLPPGRRPRAHRAVLAAVSA